MKIAFDFFNLSEEALKHFCLSQLNWKLQMIRTVSPMLPAEVHQNCKFIDRFY